MASLVLAGRLSDGLNDAYQGELFHVRNEGREIAKVTTVRRVSNLQNYMQQQQQ